MSKSRSQRYYDSHPEAKAKKAAYDKKHNAKPEQRKKRSELNKYNRENPNSKKGDGKDAYHKGNKIAGLKNQSKNRGSKSDSAGDRRARGKKK
jgi:hypothetical protein